MSSDGTIPRWYVEMYPLHDDCSARSWKNAHVVSWKSADDCAAKLLHHLVESKLHYVPEGLANEMVHKADILHEYVPKDWMGKDAECEGPEREELPPPPRQGSTSRSSKDKDRGKRGRSRDKKAAKRPSTPERHSRRSLRDQPAAAASATVAEGMLVVQSKAPFPILQQDMVQVPRQTLQRMLDCVERSLNATSHAVRLAGAARSSFETEEGHLAECTRAIEKLVNRREI